MKILGLILARKGNQRFPGKHHALALGKPLFLYTVEAALAAKSLEQVVVSSDDPAIERLVEGTRAQFIQRPEELASATASMDDAARHVCRWLESHEGFRPEAVCVMQGNIPVRKPGQIDEAIERLSTLPQATAVCTAEAVRERPEWFKRFVDERTQQAAPYLPGTFGYRTQDFAPLYRIDGAVMVPRLATLYAYESDRSVHAWLGPRTHLLIQEDARYSLEVDYPDEVALAEFYLLCERYGPKWYEEWVRQCMRDEKLEVGSRK